MNNILVTGGGGFIGFALIRRLVKLGYNVSSFSRNTYVEHKTIGIKTFQGDISNFSEIEQACMGMDTVFHVAAKVGIWGSYKDYYKTNVTGTKNVIEASQKCGIRRLIFTSSASVVFDGTDMEGADESIAYPNKHLSNYTATKAMAEHLVLQANSEKLKTISLRPHLVWGPGDTQLKSKIIERAKSGRLRKVGRKTYFTDTTFIENFIDAQILAFLQLKENPLVSGRAFFITNGEPVRIWDFINELIKSAGYPAVEKTVPIKVALFAAWLNEKTHFNKNTAPFITRFVIYEMCSHHWFDISAARKMLGYSPMINFNEGMKLLNLSK